MAKRRRLVIECQDTSIDVSWTLLSRLLKALTGARHVTISPEVLTDEESTYKLNTHGGASRDTFELPF